jgi:hypothetical protein
MLLLTRACAPTRIRPCTLTQQAACNQAHVQNKPDCNEARAHWCAHVRSFFHIITCTLSLAHPHKRAERHHININSHSCITHANERAHAHNIVSTHATRRFMLGMMCASVAAAAMVGGATFYGMPVSTTHAVVGAVIGFSFVRTTDGLIWFKGSSGLGPVMMSWVVSPLFAGIVAAVLYTAFRKFCFQVSSLTSSLSFSFVI